MGYSGCLGKIFRYTFGQYMFAVFIHLKCAILSTGNGVAIVQVVAKILTRGIKILSIDLE
jgi:hypothetical protein